MSRKNGNTEEKRRGGRTNYTPWIRLFKRLAIVAAIVLVGFLVWKNWEKIAPEALLDWTEQQFGDSEAGEGFPIAANGNAVIDMAEVNQHLAVLTDTTLQFRSGSAALVAERSHSFTDAVMYTAGNYVLCAELGGSRFRLDTRRETVLEHQLENRRIYAADLLSNGTTALVLNSTSQSYLSEIMVLNDKGKVLYEYRNSKYLLTDISMAPSGKQIAAVGTTTESGMLKSVLLVITLSSGETREYTGADVLLHNVTYFAGGTILAVGDTEIWSVKNGSEQPEITACVGVEPVGYTATSSVAGVALQRAGTTNSCLIWVFNSHGKKVQEAELQGNFRSLSARGGNLLLLTDNVAYDVTASGVKEEFAVPADSLMAVIYRRSPLLLTLGELKRLEN